MPPRVRLTPAESEVLPRLLEQVAQRRQEFPSGGHPSEQASWIAQRYAGDAALSVNLITLLLFEHGVHRSADQVAQDLAILPQDTELDSNQ